MSVILCVANSCRLMHKNKFPIFPQTDALCKKVTTVCKEGGSVHCFYSRNSSLLPFGFLDKSMTKTKQCDISASSLMISISSITTQMIYLSDPLFIGSISRYNVEYAYLFIPPQHSTFCYIFGSRFVVSIGRDMRGCGGFCTIETRKSLIYFQRGLHLYIGRKERKTKQGKRVIVKVCCLVCI